MSSAPHYCLFVHDDVIKWKHFPRYWPFVRGIHRSPVNSPHNGQWRGALIFSLICVWINGWTNNHEAGDLRRYRTHYDVIVMWCPGGSLRCEHVSIYDIDYAGESDLNPPQVNSGRVTHICVSKLTIIGSNNGMSLGRCQAIIWTNAGILLIRTSGTNYSKILRWVWPNSFSTTASTSTQPRWLY